METLAGVNFFLQQPIVRYDYSHFTDEEVDTEVK